ncbi:GDSL-type esterase/lipase family protein [Streptomyces poriferorum]|uniref:GDSL-type esterase/lipase family protein n=1 Tax=Streptomyces poriferorum TaxID=2798799 RepID=A0ABY9ISD9_9ACTN|nr:MULTISPECIES: GDSL-type esterase/lipase family protein [unclassified Streptomyces]MDP5312650.1 GDSL-type esterase/lipase family protein [Streptomyces sp. Alt4]WLQ58325.1 GDSL-type esterase/lipase family protein [Streptomyces sp. Alt2]
MRSRRHPLLAALLAALFVLAAGLGLAGAPSTATAAATAAAAPVRIMPLGDSITGSPGCWRSLLWDQLQKAGYTDIDFVGTLNAQSCALTHDADNEGHGGFLATTTADQNLLPGWLATTAPDIVVMHFGTNDVWSSIAPDTILAAYTKLVGQMRASNPAMKVLVAQIIPINPSSCAECAARTVAFNERIPAWARGITTAQSPVTVVDQWTGFDTATDTYDGVHPNAVGDAKMAARWFPALSALLTPGDPENPEEPGNQGCSAAFRTVSAWQGGYQGEVTVTNTSATARTSSWAVTLGLPAGSRLTQVWNGALTGTTVRDAGWNGTLTAGASTTFGFLASTSEAAGTPSLAASCAAS